MVECFLGKKEVIGSIPILGSSLLTNHAKTCSERVVVESEKTVEIVTDIDLLEGRYLGSYG